ncbi:hypothetical protein Bca52824_095412 [Brassica carinata]|uniref:Ubiquitin-like domain-containing protein n=1 Tax=Brassica carinata TaxID=52824 RepID=A0A8X7NYX7_BRACI|nr:hypothetical protein Bca52824_095412 [Brassica carinata]
MEEDEVVEPGKEVEMEMDEEEMKLVADGMRAANLEESGGSVKVENMNEEAPMRIVKNWKRPEDRIPTERDPTKVVISPITGELIPINEMSEHMISLLIPSSKSRRTVMFAKIRETTLAQDDEIAKNIVGLARLRPDIFGTTEEEVSNAVKAEIEKKKDEQPMQVIWDGHAESIGRTANQALAQNANGEEQVSRSTEAIRCSNDASHASTTPALDAWTSWTPPMMMNRPAQCSLVGSATIRVSVPNVDEGQVIEITVQSLSENVGSLKEKIAGETQIPANKQKLSGKAGFLKDNMSLAHYNVGAGEILTLSLRERGGRKR